MLPQGHYAARAVEGVLSKTKGGTDQVAVSFELLDEPWTGQRITWYGFLTAKTAERTIESLIYCGWEGDNLADLRGIDANDVSLEIEHDTYEGQTRAKVKWVNRAGGLAVTPMDPGSAQAIAQQMRGTALAVRERLKAKGGLPRPGSNGNGATPPAGYRGAARGYEEPPPIDDAALPF